MIILAPCPKEIWKPTRRSLVRGAAALAAATALPPHDADARRRMLGVYEAASADSPLNLIFADGAMPSGVTVRRESSGLYFNSSNHLANASPNVGRIDYGQNGGSSGGGSSFCRGLMCEPNATAFQGQNVVIGTTNYASTGTSNSGFIFATLTGPDNNELNRRNNSASSIVARGTGPWYCAFAGNYLNTALANFGFYTHAAVVRLHPGASKSTSCTVSRKPRPPQAEYPI